MATILVEQSQNSFQAASFGRFYQFTLVNNIIIMIYKRDLGRERERLRKIRNI